MLTLQTPPRGLFRGRNFMTPDIVGYYKLRDGYAELSVGEGFTRETIYGVTVRPETEGDGIYAANRRSKMFHSKRAALAYIEEMS
jgi:hypothetical protein